MSRHRCQILSIYVLFLIFSPLASQAQSADHLQLHQGSLKLIRDGRSHFLWKPGLKLRLLPGDKLHTGSATKVSIKLQQGAENIELYSHAFFAVEGIAEDQRNVALLVGKGNFSLPPAPVVGELQEAQDEASEKNQRVVAVKKDGELARVPAGDEADEEKNTEEISQANQKKENIKKTTSKRANKKLARLGKRKPTGLRSRKKRFKVRTVSALVGVRGTEFVVASAGDSTNVFTVTGEVTLASAEMPEYEVVLPKDSVSRVSKGKAPSQPVTVPPAAKQQILESGSTEGFQDVEFGPEQTLGEVQEAEMGQPQEAGDTGVDEEINILDQLETLDAVQQVVESAENAIKLSETRMLILKTNITPR